MLEQETSFTSNDSQQANISKSPQSQLCDKILINYAQDAIKTIKTLRQQCTIKSIFSFLREHKPDDERIQHLTEKELARQLDLGVSDGILSRKFGSEWQQKQLATNTPVKMNQQANNYSTALYSIPLNNEQNDSKQHDILTLLIKSIAILNKQNFNLSQHFPENNETEQSCSLNSICKYLLENYKFQLDTHTATITEQISTRLNEYICFLLISNEKIFVKVNSSEQFTYKLNSNYIQKKLKQQQQLKQSPSKLLNITQSDFNDLKADSVLAIHLDTDFIFKNLHFKPPFSIEQILKIESIKKVTSLDSTEM